MMLKVRSKLNRKIFRPSLKVRQHLCSLKSLKKKIKTQILFSFSLLSFFELLCIYQKEKDVPVIIFTVDREWQICMLKTKERTQRCLRKQNLAR